MSKGIKISKKHGVNPMITQCFWCGKEIGIALVGYLPGDEEAPRKAVVDYEPCDECRSYMEQGITFIEVDSAEKLNQPEWQKGCGFAPTGDYAVFDPKILDALDMDEDMKAAIIKAGRAAMDTKVFQKILKDAQPTCTGPDEPIENFVTTEGLPPS